MEPSTSTYLGHAALAAFFAVVPVFLYREKVSFEPPPKRHRLAWKLSHFGAAAVFAVVSAFFFIGGNPTNDVFIGLAFGVPLAIALSATASGFILAIGKSNGDEV